MYKYSILIKERKFRAHTGALIAFIVNFGLGFIFVISSSSASYAYIDPGSGSALVTAILGFFAAIGYIVQKNYYRFKRLFKKAEPEKKENAE